MKRLQRAAILLSLAEELKSQGSWCGETHIQKATYFLQEMLNAELEYGFIFYKHGPFSFDLSGEIGALRYDMLLDVVPQHPYGPTLKPSDNWSEFKKRYKITRRKHRAKINFVAEWFGSKGVAELERLGTAFYVTRDESAGKGVDERADKIHELKPHVSLEEAKKAIQEVDEKDEEAQSLITS